MSIARANTGARSHHPEAMLGKGEDHKQDQQAEDRQPRLAEPEVRVREGGVSRAARLESRAVLVGGGARHA